MPFNWVLICSSQKDIIFRPVCFSSWLLSKGDAAAASPDAPPALPDTTLGPQPVDVSASGAAAASGDSGASPAPAADADPATSAAPDATPAQPAAPVLSAIPAAPQAIAVPFAPAGPVAAVQDFPAWAQGTNYLAGNNVSYNGQVYRALQTHRADASNWDPIHAAALWQRVIL